MSADPDLRGTLQSALAHATRLLERQPATAIEQAHEILKVIPNQPQALWLLATAWRDIGDQLTALGDTRGAEKAYAQNLRFSTSDPRLLAAASHLCEGRIAPAEALLRQHLKSHPTDIAAIRMLAEVAARLGRYADAENLLNRCLDLAPDFLPARHNLAVVLHRQQKLEQALGEIDRALAKEPRNPGYRNLKAAVLSRMGDQSGAIRLYGEVLTDFPLQPKVWMSYGHALRAAGRQSECIDAYRRSIELAPNLGESYWSLANLKTYRFTRAEIEAMRAQLERTDLIDTDRFHFEFALGKALEDAREFETSFGHYLRGNALRRGGLRYDPNEHTDHVRRSKATLTRELFGSRKGAGSPAPDPIFVVGLPRSGSTLVEQMLSSHSQVEGTMELPDIIGLARMLGGRKLRTEVSRYPEILTTLGADELKSLGDRYLEQTKVQRHTAKPFFIDKMPNNFEHVGLIHLILPNAKIVDVRRHPLGCCFSGFKQHFARGQHFSYGLEDIGRYYRDYVELMAHFDNVLPGRVHRVLYERLIDDAEGEVRRLLEYCNLPFEPQCLRFHENARAVRTASSEQVRTPLYREGVDHWRNYEPWLGPLKQVLGPVLDAYPLVPAIESSRVEM
jgi:tetratricopeptide (TPR) repeat protein